jgi:hypothetical protein
MKTEEQITRQRKANRGYYYRNAEAIRLKRKDYYKALTRPLERLTDEELDARREANREANRKWRRRRAQTGGGSI